MSKDVTLHKIRELGLLAVIRGPSVDLTIEIVAALVAGGVTGIEITFTTPGATDVVAALAQQFGDSIVLGMGTLTEPVHATQAVAVGAQFLVSPHTEAQLAQAMVATGLPIMMGAFTPTEVMESVRLGSDVVKLFPGSLGGPAYMKALKGPFPNVPMMPTGGVSKDNLGDWFAAGALAVGAGSQLCPNSLALARRFDEITAVARSYVAAIAAARQS